jgi:enamine deaminase RidA (YjgF/YER057c/UK114 family)
MRQSASSGSPLEPIIGFTRAVKIGNIAAVAGTAPIGSDGTTVGIDDPAAQMRRCLEISRDALAKLGVPLSSVIRTRILLTRIEDFEVVAKVHGEFFSSIKPVTTVMQVSRFINPQWLVETEVDAVLDSE